MSYEEFISTFFSFDTDPVAESLSDIVPCLATSHCASQATQARVVQTPVRQYGSSSIDSHATCELGGCMTPQYEAQSMYLNEHDSAWPSPRAPLTPPFPYNENELEALSGTRPLVQNVGQSTTTPASSPRGLDAYLSISGGSSLARQSPLPPTPFMTPEAQLEVDEERPRKKAKKTAGGEVKREGGRMKHRGILPNAQAEGDALHQPTYTSTTSTHKVENPAGEPIIETVQQRRGGPSVQMPAEEQDGAQQSQVILDPCVCPVCGFRSSRKYDVRRHMRTHKDQVEGNLPTEEGEEESRCDECDRVFARDDSLRRHKERKHDIRPPPRKLSNKRKSRE